MDQWTAENIPDQSGKTALVTGANSGIGFEAAKELARKGASVILAVRDLEKGEHARQKILKEIPAAELTTQFLDLTNLASIARFAETFKREHDHLDLLLNNAGIMIPPYRLTKDGFESQFGTNHLGHFALTAQLFPLIQATAKSRIVNVSSSAHKMGNINFDDLHWEKRRFIRWRAYGDSKIANLYFSYELTRKIAMAQHDIVVTAAHPGWAATNLQKTPVMKVLNKIFAQSASRGALPSLRAATDPACKGGEYFGPRGFAESRGAPVKVKSNRRSYDTKIAAKLWTASEQLTGITFQVET